MTEFEWLTSLDPSRMIVFLGSGTSCRKLRLFACACVRNAWQIFTDPNLRQAIEVAERHADGHATADELLHGFGVAETLCPLAEKFPAILAALPDAYAAAYLLTTPQTEYDGGQGFIYSSHGPDDSAQAWMGYRDIHATLLRDVFGNPFRRVTLSSSLQNETIKSLARRMYDSREFRAMPILADALEDAGCDNSDIVDHCRGAGPHVPGCWVVDLILERG